MRILLVANGYPPSAFGGVEVNSVEVARELKRRGHSLAVFCRERAPQRPDRTVIQDVVDEAPVTRVVNDYKRVTAFRQLYADERIDALFGEQLESFQPDLVHFNHLLALSATLPQETARRGIAAVATLHDYWSICQRVNLIDSRHVLCPGPQQGGDCFRCLFVDSGERGWVVRFLKQIMPYNLRIGIRRLISRPGNGALLFSATPTDLVLRQQTFRKMLAQVQRITVPSQFVRQMLVANGYLREQIEVLPLGIGLCPQPRRSRSQEILRFGFVGSILPVKGLESLVRAFHVTSAENIRLEIYGREDIQPVFARQVHMLAAGDSRIRFHGGFSPDQRQQVYAGLDVFVMPSVWHETFSYVAREALLSGIPVIAARVGALPEVISDGINGYLYPPGDETALSTLIEQLAGHPERIDRLETPGPVDLLDLGAYVDRLEAAYENGYKSVRNL